jgi:hypothetical protein
MVQVTTEFRTPVDSLMLFSRKSVEPFSAETSQLKRKRSPWFRFSLEIVCPHEAGRLPTIHPN